MRHGDYYGLPGSVRAAEALHDRLRPTSPVGTVPAFLACGLMALLAVPRVETADTFFSDLGLRGLEWAILLLIPPVAGGLAYAATRLTAIRKLREMR